MNKQMMLEEIMYLFYTKNTKWKIDGVLQEPSKQDIERVLDSLKATLYANRTATQAQTGGLLIEKQDDRYEVYLHLGELND